MRLGYERFNERKQVLLRMLPAAGSLEELLYRLLFEALGYSKNSDPLLDLASRIPLGLARQCRSSLELEALYFGTAGLLQPEFYETRKPGEPLPDHLKLLQGIFADRFSKFGVAQMQPLSWRFFRLRPANFPTLRIAQGITWLAAGQLLHDQPLKKLANAAVGEKGLTRLRAELSATPGIFWRSHVRFGGSAVEKDRPIGRDRIDKLIANVVLPILQLHAEQIGKPQRNRHLARLYKRMPAESTETTRIFESLGDRPRSIVESQGQRQLFRSRCSSAGCFSCVIGRHILRQDVAASIAQTKQCPP